MRAFDSPGFSALRLGLTLLALNGLVLSPAAATAQSGKVVWPLGNTTTPDSIDKPFGFRVLCGACTDPDDADFHRGVDFKANKGTPVYAVADTTVARWSTNDPALPRWGKFVVLALPSMFVAGEKVDTHQVAYLHLDSIDPKIKSKSLPVHIKKGDKIGTVGKSGQGISSVHLHFDYYQGSNDGGIHREEAVNPLRLLPYTSQASTLVQVTRESDSTLRLTVRQDPSSLDITRFEVNHDGQSTTHGSDPIVLDFEEKIGINMTAPEYEDMNPFESTTYLPKYFSQNSSYYELKMDFDGDWASASEITVGLTNARGAEETHSFTLMGGS